MVLAAVRSIGFSRALQSSQDEEDFEQELVDQFALAQVGAGLTDQLIGTERSVIFEFSRFLGRPLWTASPSDADRFLAFLRHERRQARGTRESKEGTNCVRQPGLASSITHDSDHAVSSAIWICRLAARRRAVER
ncbi:hypothetical protein [Arthrobacter sp. Soil736]|uniref:hypothetical protein n=1 Tax=Arthrobacter sp. Soil736 TaxID=1736395 RepID=UPI00190FCD04|nr:hypothetical protein [Arthrobacter sp. Soil736]